MFKTVSAVFILIVSAACNAAGIISCTMSGQWFNPVGAWPYDTFSISAQPARDCIGRLSVCTPLPTNIGGNLQVQGTTITVDVYGNDGPLPPVQSSSLQWWVGPLTPGTYTLTTHIHNTDSNGAMWDCPNPRTSTFQIRAATGTVQRLTAVEFYNTKLDHYFVSANAPEIADLDNGVHPGWTRTGQTFTVFAPSQSGETGVPVCRFYGLPSAGLDSHFYTADQTECAAIPQRFHGAWQLETPGAFEVWPMTADGCAPGFTPVYRLWNQRSDSNHRFTTNFDAARVMSLIGYFMEQPNMCAPAP